LQIFKEVERARWPIGLSQIRQPELAWQGNIQQNSVLAVLPFRPPSER
jgi:hypothetical protein